MKKLGFGMMRLPLADPNVQSKVDLAQVCDMVDTFLARGFTYFDTAYMYHDHNSENIVRQALVERHPREAFTLATKMPLVLMKDDAPQAQEQIFREQLEKCGVTYFDYYLLHCLNPENYRRAQALGSFAFLQEKKAAGLARHVGFSFHGTADLLDEILTAHPEVDFVQLQINYLDWESENVQSHRCYEVASRHGKSVVVMEPVKGGTLAHMVPEAEALLRGLRPDWSLASWGIRFAASLPNVMVVLSGMSDLEQLRDNTATMADFHPLTGEEEQAAFQAADILRRSAVIPCTACRYCVEGCPQHIAIPEYFALYNTIQQMGGQMIPSQLERYRMYGKDHAKASACVACGQCETACPQHIPVPQWLEKVAATFEP